MRCLILGAGGVGGYFGGRLLAAGRDVTFLVRPARAERMARDGLRILSPNGDLHLTAPPTVTRETISAPYDLIILSCKAYDLDSALEAIAPAVGPETAILPLLNGMAHMQALTARFGPGAVLGGCCAVSTVLDAEGRIHQMGAFQSLNFGEMTGTLSPRAKAIGEMLDGCGFAVKASPTIAQDMWEKWMFIASAAGMTCLMRAAIGDIEAAGANDLTLALIDECAAVAKSAGHAPRPPALERARTSFTEKGSALTASMFRDIEAQGRIEAEQIIGDLYARGRQAGLALPILRIIDAHLKAYEARRARMAAG